MTGGRPFGRWLAGDGSEIVLHTESAGFTRGLIRERIDGLREAILGALSDRAGLVVVIGPNDDHTLCASVAGQLAGRLTAVVDPRSAGEVERVLATNDVAAVLVVRGASVNVPPGAASLDVDQLIAAVDREVEADGHPDGSTGRLSDGFAPRTGDCVVLFSSGSTGMPKGIVRSHESMLRTWSAGELRALEKDPCIAVAGPLGYVSSQLIVHQAWRSGVPIALFDGVGSGLVGFVAFMKRAGVTMMSSQVAPYRSMLELPQFGEVGLRWLSLWGEPLLGRDFERHRVVQPRCHLMFGYGSTEMMVAGCKDSAPGAFAESPARFHPFVDVLLAVEGAEPAVEGGSTGELLVHNPWLATGYLGDAEKTAATFVERDGRRWARTGDRVTLYPDRTFELHGRVDDRLKVLGNNVEPSAVEAVLTSLPDIADAAVVGADRPGGGVRLAAFVVRRDGLRQDVSELRRAVAAALPAYAVPATWTLLDALPRLATGKIDRPLLRRQAESFRYSVNPDVRPTNDIELTVLRHVGDLLGIEEIGIDDDLMDLGLDSLMLAELQVRLVGVLPVPPTLTAMAKAPTVRAIGASAGGDSVLVPLDDDGLAGRTVDERIRIVLVPGAGASVLYLRPLARRLGRMARVSAVPAAEFETIPRLVKATVAALVADGCLTNDGGVVFVGHSWGGLAALELARGAISAGLEVFGVVLLDTPVPESRRFVERLRIRLRLHDRWSTSRAARRPAVLPSAAPTRALFSIVGDQTFHAQLRDASARRWRPISCPCHLVVSDLASAVDPDGWRPFFPAGMSVSTVSAGHTSMVAEPVVADVADATSGAVAGWLRARRRSDGAALGSVSSSP